MEPLTRRGEVFERFSKERGMAMIGRRVRDVRIEEDLHAQDAQHRVVVVLDPAAVLVLLAGEEFGVAR